VLLLLSLACMSEASQRQQPHASGEAKSVCVAGWPAAGAAGSCCGVGGKVRCSAGPAEGLSGGGCLPG
jgi:hypothetical protein